MLRLCTLYVLVRTLNSYLLSRVMKTFSSYLSKPFQKIKDDFIRVLFGEYLSIFLLEPIELTYKCSTLVYAYS